MSQGGYQTRIEQMMADRLRAKQEEHSTRIERGEVPEGTPISPPSEIDREDVWLAGRMTKTGSFKVDATREVADKIMDLKAQSSQGSFVPSGRRDVLMNALGKKDHPGRVLSVPGNVTIKEYYGKSASRKRVVDEASILADITQHLMSNPAITTHLMQSLISNPEFKQALAREISSVGTSKDTAGHANPSHVSTKESFSRAHVEDDELAAREREFEVQRHEHELEMKRRELELDSKRRELEMLTKSKSMSVSLSPITRLFSLGEDYTFEIFECPLEHDGWVEHPDQRRIFTFCGDDLGNTCRNNVWMNNNVFSLWCKYLHRLQLDKGVASVYGFLDPSVLLPQFFDGDGLSKYIGNLLGDNRKELYLAPYCMKNHWQLFVLHPYRHTVIFFCSLHQDPPPKVVEAVNNALKTSSISCANGRSRTSKAKSNPVWNILKSRFQIDGWSCSYYVMLHMLNIVSTSITDGWNKAFNDQSPIQEDELRDLRMCFAEFFFKYAAEKGIDKIPPQYLDK